MFSWKIFQGVPGLWNFKEFVSRFNAYSFPKRICPEMHLWVSVLGQSLPTYPFKLPSSHFGEEMHASVQPSPIIIVIRCSGLEKPVGRAKGQLETRHLGTRIPWVLCVPRGPARRWSRWWEQSAPALGGPHFQHLVKWGRQSDDIPHDHAHLFNLRLWSSLRKSPSG